MSGLAGGTPLVIVCVHPCSHRYSPGGGMELTERITSRVTELTGEVELLRKQLAEPSMSWTGW